MPERISETGPLTAVHLTIVAVLIVLVILGMIWGARLKRKRVAAEHIEEKRLEEAGVPASGEANARHQLEDTVTSGRPARDRTPSAASTPASDDANATSRPFPLADEPVAAASSLEASPASEAEPTPATAATAAAGSAPVTQLKGLGPKVAARLAELGITSVGQLAALDDREAADLDVQLGTFKGRMARDRWIEQAQLLASGDKAGFEAKFGKL